ncbi:hypothetical protein LZZ90_07530 [Flavobacterium sp. SM15]|uniref:hypothetical protein n=1 Tax=Flavobacterium sp. SM15 TaxID=2908005 RepID=UPI001EDAE258|nr:hypothetical protein [Flavobacterium sp. SM15]MCG2611355.1 hypothetical protein [Flavobacterium sp. SM15]
MKRLLFLLIAFFFCGILIAQKANDYKYIIVPVKYSFLDEPNKYNLSALTKMVFEKQGYQVFYENDILPEDLAENRCNALYADMKGKSSMFITKIVLELKDCQNQVVFTSVEGKSNEKEYKVAYIQAFREVGKSVEQLKSNAKHGESIKTELITAPEKLHVESSSVITKNQNDNLWYPQATAYGFQLVDKTPKVVMKLYKTSQTNLFIAQKDSKQGVVFTKNNQWWFEYYQNELLVSEKLEIKF